MASGTPPSETSPAYYPAFLNLRGRSALVVGGGAVATTKVEGLLPCGLASLRVVAPHASPSIQAAAADGLLTWLPRDYQSGDVHAAQVVFAATDDRAMNARVAADARVAGALVLAVDDPPNCDFIAPALVRRGDLTLAISTNGQSPAMARRTRELLERLVPDYWGDLLSVAAQVRQRLRASGRSVDPESWNAALNADLEHLLASGQRQAAIEYLQRALLVGEPEAVHA